MSVNLLTGSDVSSPDSGVLTFMYFKRFFLGATGEIFPEIQIIQVQIATAEKKKSLHLITPESRWSFSD